MQQRFEPTVAKVVIEGCRAVRGLAAAEPTTERIRWLLLACTAAAKRLDGALERLPETLDDREARRRLQIRLGLVCQRRELERVAGTLDVHVILDRCDRLIDQMARIVDGLSAPAAAERHCVPGGRPAVACRL